jgi:hypothetical protein
MSSPNKKRNRHDADFPNTRGWGSPGGARQQAERIGGTAGEGDREPIADLDNPSILAFPWAWTGLGNPFSIEKGLVKTGSQ